jgi:hypothetical protein
MFDQAKEFPANETIAPSEDWSCCEAALRQAFNKSLEAA